jgi:Dyp-type peroxidase family
VTTSSADAFAGDAPATDDRIQRGVFFRSGERPPPSFGLLLLNVTPGARPAEAADALAALWVMLTALADGEVRDLRPTRDGDPRVEVPGGRLTCLLGYGARLFDERLHVPRLAPRELRPYELTPLRRAGAGAPFPKMPWAPEADREEGEADVALQLLGQREVTVARAVVEVSKLIADESLPLEVVALHRGFQRDDERSWIDFHDGINNMASHERRQAIEVAVADPAWMLGGTYLAFLRVLVDLPAWRVLPREHQEVVVGREKLAGCPLRTVELDPAGALVPVPVEPCPLPDDAGPAQVEAHRNPGRSDSALVEASHIHRSNLNRGAPDSDANNRIFRQGYDFLDVGPDGRIHVGLHFVSFSRTLGRVTQILRLHGWQGDSNFGGPEPPGPGEPAVAPLTVGAGGFYAIPPREAPFPGSGLL